MSRTRIDEQVTTSTEIAHDGVHGGRCANKSVNRAGMNAFCAANAVIFINNCQHTYWRSLLFFTIEWLRLYV